MVRKFFLIGLLIISILHVDAQVTAVKYLLSKSEKPAELDISLIIVEGETNSAVSRVQFNAQISIVVPQGLKPTLGKIYNPIENNINLSGKTPAKWKIMSSVLAPAATPESDYYSIIPELHPTSFYNNLKKGDTIKLFTLVFNDALCTHKVRLFDNDHDPNPEADGMNGADFINTFTMGSTDRIYTGNVHQNPKKILSLNKRGFETLPYGKSYQWYMKGEAKAIQNSSEPMYKPSKPGTFYVKIVGEFCELVSEDFNYKK